MKITNTTTSMVNQAYTNSASNGSQAAKPAPGIKAEPAAIDSVTLSASAKDLNMVKLAMDNEPQSRSEKIQTLKTSVAQGSYAVDPEKIADKILGSSRFHEIV
ncbi:MAG: flagellar biosynthesis anti-sigma factor FlgM [Pseudomonadota bacterium]